MTKKYSGLFVIMSLLVFTLTESSAEDLRQGQLVFLKQSATPLIDGQVVDIHTLPWPARIEAVEGNSVWIEGKACVAKEDCLDVDQAIQYFTGYIDRFPAHYAPRYSRGKAWMTKGDLDKAIEDFTDALKLNPSDAEIFMDRDNAWKRKQCFDEADTDFGIALKLKPASAVILSNFGMLRIAESRYEDAIRIYTQAISIDPNMAGLYLRRGIALGMAGKLDDAIDDFTKGIERDPTNVQLVGHRGLSRQYRGDFDGAMEDFTKGIKAAPLLPEGYRCRAMLMASAPDEKVRNGKAAMIDATEACRLSSWNDLYSLEALAAAYAEIGNFERAVFWQSKVIDLSTTASERLQFENRLILYKKKKPYRFAIISKVSRNPLVSESSGTPKGK